MENPYDVVELNEVNIIETRDDLFWELQTTGSVFILSHEVTIFELLEDMDQDNKDTIISMLVVGNEDAKEYALENIMDAFKSAYDDAVIEEVYIDQQQPF